MLAKTNRFHGQGSVRYVLRRGQTVRGQSLSVKFVRGQRHPDYRAAVVVSKKVSKSAPKRNRIRRRIYEQLRTLTPALPPDVDVIVMVFDDSIATMPADELKNELTKLLAQLKRGAAR